MKRIFMLTAALLFASHVHGQVALSIEQSVTVSWQGQPGKFYAVLVATNLASPSWETVEYGIIGTTNVITRSYVSSAPCKYFKVREDSKSSLDHRLVYNQQLSGLALTQCSFNSSDIIMTSFTNSLMNVTDFYGATIDFCDFTGADLRSASFQSCPYISASFYGSTLWNTIFNGSYLLLCDFRDAAFNAANPGFNGATMIFCDFTGATGFDPAGGHFVACIMPDGSFRDDP